MIHHRRPVRAILMSVASLYIAVGQLSTAARSAIQHQERYMRDLKKHLWATAVLALCFSGAALADDEVQQCFQHKLNGLYVFSATGYMIVGGVAQPKAIVELIRFNGDG